jgi:DNA mismatch endonuclease (patch repair protein)
MSMIRGKNTKPEIALRKLLFKNGVKGYRLHAQIIGKPDIVFRKKRLIVFVDGCFWHKCPMCFAKPSTTKKYWVNKIASNKSRDKIINRKLKKTGWTVLRFWEHEIVRNPGLCFEKIIKCLGSR